MLSQISDFFGSYPSISPKVPTENSIFTSLISRKQEFNELRPGLTESAPVRGGAFKHQKMAVRYLTWYDRLLLIHEPGTGKSCIVAHSAEMFKNEWLKDPKDPTKIDRAIILVRGETLTVNIKNEIVCKCTDRVYETEKVLRSVGDETTMRANITRELSTWYDIMGYHEFAQIIRKARREEDVERFMSNKIIYCEEAHNIATIHDIRSGKASDESDKQNESDYETILNAFHKGKRNKIVLVTATPMINSPIDIIPIINLLLPANMQMPRWRYEQEEEFANQPFEVFEPYFRGRVSYIRSLVTGAIEVSVGETFNANGLPIMAKIYPAPMSTFQYGVYLQAQNEDRSNTRNVSVYDKPRQASNFVFPDGSYAKAGFDKYLERDKDHYIIKRDENGANLSRLIQSEEGLNLLSAKYFEMVQICKEAYPNPQASRAVLQETYPGIYELLGQFPGAELAMDDSRGIVFVYFPDYVHGSGAIMFGKCLEAQGYQEFREQKSIFVSSQETNRVFGPCSSYAESLVERESRLSRAPRYAILSGSEDVTPKSRIAAILNTLNSYENRYGHYLQVLIGSKSAREGININNASRRIMASSNWHNSANYQANERVFRSTSHIYRIAEKRRLLQAAGLPAEDVVFSVQTYNMASVYYGLEEEVPKPSEEYLQNENVDTIDVKMYAQAERKDRLNKQILRYMKRSAYDCFLNKKRNVRPTDIPGSPTCDYMDCDYPCAGIREDVVNKIDRQTKILYYSDDEVNQAAEQVKRLFTRFYSLTIEQIQQLIHQYDPVMDPLFINMAIEKLIRENNRLLDRMGFYSYLRESSSGVIYLEKDPFETRDQPENTAYTSVLIGTQDPNNNTFYDYAVGIQLSAEKAMVQQLKLDGPTHPDFNTMLNQLSVTSKVHLLEDAYYKRTFEGYTDEWIEGILTAFQNSVYQTLEPRDLLRKVSGLLSNKGKTRGRPPNPNTQPKIKKLGLSGDFVLPPHDRTDIGEVVILHTIYNQASHDRTSYSAITRYLKADGLIRILKPSEGIGWRNVNEYEHIVYNNIIQKNITAIQNEYERFPIYGIMIPPKNQLHIRDRESENSSQVAVNAKLINDGRVCNNWNKGDLVDILYRLGISYPYDGSPFNREAVIRYLYGEKVNKKVENFEDRKLVHFYYWYLNKTSRDQICVLLKNHFEQNGMLFTGRVVQTVTNPATVGSINVAPDMTTADYNEKFDIPTGSPVPAVPSQIMPQFASSAPDQPAPQPIHVVQVVPEASMAMPQTQTSFTQPPVNIMDSLMQ